MDDDTGTNIKTDSDMIEPVVRQLGFDTNVDYVINEYMERLGTRLNILETELKYAWRALDLLSQEYIKMWERLEKLEGLLYEQQSVISQLLDFYTSGGTPNSVTTIGPTTSAILEGRLGELEVIREILGNGTVEDGLEEGLDVTICQEENNQELNSDSDVDNIHVPDEAFYKSLNQAFRDDLVEIPPSRNRLGLIWEEREECEEFQKNKITSLKGESKEIYSSSDYKDYRGNTPCISEQDMVQLSRIDSIDPAAIEKLSELDRLSNKLHQDSVNIKQLQRKLLESPISVSEKQGCTNEIEGNESSYDDSLLQIFPDEKWSFTDEIKDQQELFILAHSDLSNMVPNVMYLNRPNSRLSATDTDNEVAETLAGGLRTPTSPRKRNKEVISCTAPFTTVTGRLAYSAAVQHVESVEAAAAAANVNNPFICDYDSNSLISVPFDTVSSSTPNIFNITSERTLSPTLSISSLRTRQDGYIDRRCSPSPPPPAPMDITESSSLVKQSIKEKSTQMSFLETPESSASTSVISDQGRLSPKSHLPKSPKTSPRRSKSRISNIVAAKSDSGLSSMSGWSSLEKSPSSPKNGTQKFALNQYTSEKNLPSEVPVSSLINLSSANNNLKEFSESSVDSKLTVEISNCFLPGGHPLSAFTTLKSPSGMNNLEVYGTFVPAPAPVSDINISPRKGIEKTSATNGYTCVFGADQPAIYSVAGSNRDSYTSVYTSNSADYINQTIHYPDLIEPYENNETYNAQQKTYYNSLAPYYSSTSECSHSRKGSSSKRSETLSNHDGYKNAMYRTMFPSGNITDALSYYPTSSRYNSTEVHSQENSYYTLEAQQPDDSTTSSSVRSNETYDNSYTQSPYVERKHHSQTSNVQEPTYENQSVENHYTWNQKQEIPYLELDLKNRNLPEYIVQQHGENTYYDPSRVIMTQSGYITITSENEVCQQSVDKHKKLKRGSTLKSAMNSVSQWLPDIHLTRRNRSYSLPGIRKEDIKFNLQKKKKKNGLVSTVSGIIQKAKRKTSHSQQYSQSLSDPENSEPEWSVGRTQSVLSEDDKSEDSSSVFSENQFEKDNLFPQVNETKTKRNNIQDEYNTTEDDNQENLSKTNDINLNGVKEMGKDEKRYQQLMKEEPSCTTTTAFPSTNDQNRNVTSINKEEPSVSENQIVVVVGGASMEFAVSRALGKYRQRQTYSFSDDKCEDQGVIIEELVEGTEQEVNQSHLFTEILPEKPLIGNHYETHHIDSVDEYNNPEGSSPSAISSRSHMNRFLPKHQQSLEIPGTREDDDCKSTHSWRSTSRVSSRRQSTEDSIDSEDEWYCYELRKLEEMERQTQLEQDMGPTLIEEVEPFEEEPCEPDETVKEKMSFVLRELRMNVKPIQDVLDERENNLMVIQSAKRRQSTRSSFQLDNAASLFEKVKNYHHDEQFLQNDEFPINKLEDLYQKDNAPSSGDTSGPDSPQHSTEEYDEAEMAFNEELARRYSKSRKDYSSAKKDNHSDVSIPKIHIDKSPPTEEDHSQKEISQTGSKWKLIKTLKERKAEEKNSQGKILIEPPTEKDKVSMFGFLQEFYEIWYIIIGVVIFITGKLFREHVEYIMYYSLKLLLNVNSRIIIISFL